MGLSPANKIIVVVVFLSIFVVVLETEVAVAMRYALLFSVMNTCFLIAFICEYLVRLWTAGCNPDYAGLVGRLKYMKRIDAVIDLIVIVPFVLGLLTNDIFLIRLFRLIRIISLAKIPGISHAMQTVVRALTIRKYELLVSFAVSFSALFLAAVVLYFVEREVQPEAFGSIPRALWWGIVTLTTVGYGDVYPVTMFGRLAASLFAIVGIGLIAIPTGILAAAFSENFKRHEDDHRHEGDHRHADDRG